MSRSYDGFFESTDGLVPVPGACHPALREHMLTVMATTSEEFSLDVLTYPHGEEAWPALKKLAFRRGWAYGWDMFGNYWVWPVWKDQFGRSLGGQAELWNTYAT